MDNFPLNTADLLILGVVLLSTLFALSRGFVRELLSLAAWAGATFVTIYGFSTARPFAYEILAIPILADIILAVVLFIASLLTFSLIGRAIAARVKESKLKPLDRGLGLFFGLIRGGLLVSLFYLMFAWMMPSRDQPGWAQDSKLMPLVALGASLLSELVPDDEEKERIEVLRGAREQTLDVISIGRLFQRFTDPKSAAADGKSGYNKEERGAMERLIERHQ
ncbi:MAG: hypothetical protein COA65_00925 [Rhodospirillaceae bacterium]|nr:MAG: hypothetical protein COA65_00925 [Rhodospirillaceae bacterium]